MKKVINFLLYSSVVFCSVFIFASCRKSGPADALVTVTDSTGKKIQGATVVLRQDSIINPATGIKANVKQSAVTDVNGQAVFSFPLEVFLIAEISKGALELRDYIRLEQSKKVEKTFVLK